MKKIRTDAWSAVIGLLFAAILSPLVSIAGEFSSDRVRIQVAPKSKAVLSSELAGVIDHIEYEAGDRFSAGDLLLRFDCRTYEALLDKSVAAFKAASKVSESVSRLHELDGTSQMQFDKSAFDLTIAKAEMDIAMVTVEKCDLVAPFSGTVAKRHSQPHEYVSVGEPIIEIYDHRSLEIRMIAPSLWLSVLRKGAQFQIEIDETRTAYSANIIRLGSVVDPVSQSVEVYAELPDGTADLLPGMSGWARFPGIQ